MNFATTKKLKFDCHKISLGHPQILGLIELELLLQPILIFVMDFGGIAVRIRIYPTPRLYPEARIEKLRVASFLVPISIILL